MNRPAVDDRRQSALIFNPQNVSALLIGAGSIGSVAAMLLARTGIGRIAIYDDDILEPWNCTGGIFDMNFLGEPKVEAVGSIVLAATSRDIEKHYEKYTALTEHDRFDIVIVGVDSLRVRREIWDRLELDDFWNTYIDARMGGHVCEVFSIRNDDPEKFEWYGETLGVKVASMPCGTEATSYVMARLTSMIGRSVRSVTNHEAHVPFRQYWDAEHDSEFISAPIANTSQRASIAA